MTSQFDPNTFLHATTTEALTRRPPIPSGTQLVGTIGEITAAEWASKDGTKSGMKFNVPIKFDLLAYPEIHKVVGVDSVQLSDTIMLDLTADKQGIDWSPGKNGGLRRYREALGMNTPGEPFSPFAMSGRLIRVEISHREYNNELYDEVKSVAKAA